MRPAKGLVRIAIAAALLALTGCAAGQLAGESPVIRLSSVNVEQMTVLEQRYLVGFKLQNRNPSELKIKGFWLELILNDRAFASGVSNRPVTVPGLAEAEVEAVISSSALDVYRQLIALHRDRPQKLSYELRGKVHLAGGISWPVSVSGRLELPAGADRLSLTPVE